MPRKRRVLSQLSSRALFLRNSRDRFFPNKIAGGNPPVVVFKLAEIETNDTRNAPRGAAPLYVRKSPEVPELLIR